MIQFLYNDEIDREEWDRCIENSLNPSPYALSWYLDSLCPGWCGLVDHDYRSLFPLPTSRKAGFSYIYTPVFIQRLGLFSLEQFSDKMINEFISFIPDKYRFIDLAINRSPSDFHGEVSERDNYVLSLIRDYEEIRSGYSSDCRRNLKLSGNESLEIIENVKPQEAVSLFLAGPGRKMKTISVTDFHGLMRLMSYCIKNGKGNIKGIAIDGSLVYSLFTVETGSRITTLFTATSEDSRRTRAGYYFIDKLIRENAGRSIILDFAGSSIKSIADYNRSFGAEKEIYYRLYNNGLPWPFRLLKQ
ncbi:MAG TPA: hypothetical protein VMW76_06200 [Bacteroidales bacterium]|nr:hypothetical protein [Bacteroidales bacterium]